MTDKNEVKRYLAAILGICALTAGCGQQQVTQTQVQDETVTAQPSEEKQTADAASDAGSQTESTDVPDGVSQEEQKEAGSDEAVTSQEETDVSKGEGNMCEVTILNGKPWTDTEGNLIQAHGGQVQRLTYKEEDGSTVTRWWWVGEDKTEGAHGGINAYSSDDLGTWTFEGCIMHNVRERSDLDTEPYFTALYGDRSEDELDHIYECLNAERAIIERPKLIYNERTGKYILWFHADGPTATSDSSYAAASAGVAVSDSPRGPFVFIDRYRLNTCPEDQEDFYPESKGMARDMNLFVDTDGTAYIIYSSEENLTLYISRLNEEYTYLATPPEDAVYGKDFIRLFPGSQREAPALIKHDDRYYLMTSGCTGWDPNQARYYVSDSVMGEWENMGDPCKGGSAGTTFHSQSTCLFDSGSGIVYMGDRWKKEDLPNSKYIWLPVQFDEEGRMALRWKEEWTLTSVPVD